MSKKRKSKPVVTGEIINERTNSIYTAVKEMLKNLKDNKEAYTMICGACGLVFASLWNIACDIGYRGFSDELLVDSQYIQRDNHGILVSLIIILGVAILFFPIFYAILSLAKKTAPSKIKRISIIIGSLLIAILPFVLVVIVCIFPSTYKWITTIIAPVTVLAMLSALFFMIYFPLITILLDEKNHLKEITNTDLTSANRDNSLIDKENTKLMSYIKAIRRFLMALLFTLLAIYSFGRLYAQVKTEYDFLVDSYSYDFSFDGEKIYDNIVISQTDEYYYLSVCTLSVENGSTKVTIYPYYHSVVNKSDSDSKAKVIRKKFDTVDIVKSECPLLS